MKLPSVSVPRCLFLCCMLLMPLLQLSGCSHDVSVTTVLEEIGGLRPGDKVYLDTREVGSVESIGSDEGLPGFTIGIGLVPAHAGLIQENAVAYVPPEGPPKLVLLNPSEVAAPVAPGGRLKGLSPLQLVVWQVSDAAGRASSLMEALALRIDSYFESEDWAETRAEIDGEISALAADSRSTAERVAEELQVLIESLTETAAEGVNELGEATAGIEEEIARLEAQGQTDLANSLRRLLERIEAATAGADPDIEDPPADT